MSAAGHDAYAADYDRQVQEYGSHVHEALFGLCYDLAAPGRRLLSVGIGTGLDAALFARAGLLVDGMDFSPAMLALCGAKGFAAGLIRHDVQQLPWPVPAQAYDLVVGCGVFHFIEALDGIFGEAQRVLKPGGVFAFTTKAPAGAADAPTCERQASGEWDIYAHAPAHVERLLGDAGFRPLKWMRVFVGDDIFQLWAAMRALR